jgi:hypothetical protein
VALSVVHLGSLGRSQSPRLEAHLASGSWVTSHMALHACHLPHLSEDRVD